MEIPPGEYLKVVEVADKAEVEKLTKWFLKKQYWFMAQWQHKSQRWQFAFAGSIVPDREFPRGVNYVEVQKP